MTLPKKERSLQVRGPLKVTKRRLHEQRNQLKLLKVGMQVSCGLDANVSQKGNILSSPEALGDVFHDLARQTKNKIFEGHLQADHEHMMIAIIPKYSVAQVVGYIKGKSANTLLGHVLAKRRTTMV